MSEERDPEIQAWFARTEVPLTEPDFISPLMDRVNRAHRQRLVFRGLVAILLFTFGALFRDDGIALAQLIMTQLVPIDGELTRTLLAPINSVGFILSMVILLLRFIYRRSA